MPMEIMPVKAAEGLLDTAKGTLDEGVKTVEQGVEMVTTFVKGAVDTVLQIPENAANDVTQGINGLKQVGDKAMEGVKSILELPPKVIKTGLDAIKSPF